MGIGEMSALQLMVKGGPLMWPILICSLAATAIFIEKMLYFSSITTNVTDLKRRVFDSVRDNKLKDAIIICEQNNSPVAKILKAGLIRSGANREQIKASIEEGALSEVPRMEKRLRALMTVAHTALLLGFLGTVVGIADVFRVIELRSASMSPATPVDLAGGIWQALLTTMFGLCVAIPAFLAYNYGASRVDDFVAKMEKAAAEIINLLSNLSDTHTP